MVTRTKVLSTNQTSGGSQVNGAKSSGACQPAKKNSAKVMPEYSTMWPATISDSPSTTSNGARLVSAMPETKYTTSIGSSGSQFQDRKVTLRSANQPLPCAST